MRQLVKRLLAEDVAANGLTVVIASHNLRELEDICDHIAMLHKGELLFVSELDDIKQGVLKVQVALPTPVTVEELSELDIISMHNQGSLYTIVVRGTEGQIADVLSERKPSYMEFISLTLEEIFITEMEDRGYDYSGIIL